RPSLDSSSTRCSNAENPDGPGGGYIEAFGGVVSARLCTAPDGVCMARKPADSPRRDRSALHQSCRRAAKARRLNYFAGSLGNPEYRIPEQGLGNFMMVGRILTWCRVVLAASLLAAC